jgi:hypothetical protein
MTTTYKGFKIDFKDSGAIIEIPTFKAFASDETTTGKSGLEKAKDFIDKLLR